MTTWNHRLCSYNNKIDGVSYGIYEVYYNSSGEICDISSEPVQMSGESLAELKSMLKRFNSAMKKPVVEMNGIIFAEGDW